MYFLWTKYKLYVVSILTKINDVQITIQFFFLSRIKTTMLKVEHIDSEIITPKR